MSRQPATEQKIFLNLDGPMQREIARLSLEEILRGQGVDIPPSVRLGEEALPSAEPGVREKDLGVVLSAIPELAIALGASASLVIFAISKFLKDREHAPKVLYVHRIEEITGPDGKRQRVLVKDPIMVEHYHQSRIEFETALKEGGDLVVKITAED